MRIGNIVIDTAQFTTEDLNLVIRELQRIRARRVKRDELQNRLIELFNEAKENGFALILNDCGQVIEDQDLDVYDLQ